MGLLKDDDAAVNLMYSSGLVENWKSLNISPTVIYFKSVQRLSLSFRKENERRSLLMQKLNIFKFIKF